LIERKHGRFLSAYRGCRSKEDHRMTSISLADEGISSQLEQALWHHPDAPLGTVELRVEGSRVVLLGSVASIHEKAAIYEAIDDFIGLKDIDDRLNMAGDELRLAA
jgi:osmotically-inducible protein OsmY